MSTHTYTVSGVSTYMNYVDLKIIETCFLQLGFIKYYCLTLDNYKNKLIRFETHGIIIKYKTNIQMS